MKEIDARGLSCPQPVILLKQALADQPQTCKIWVDHPTAQENTLRFAAHAGYKADVLEQGGDVCLTLSKK